MATFAFRAIDVAGAPSRGEMDAESQDQVTDQLRNRGLIVLDVSENKESVKLEDLIRRRRGVKQHNLVIASRQFATLIGSGMSMLRSLYTLEDQTEDTVLSEAIADVRKRVEGGSSLSDALARHPKVFDELYTAMVRSGEGAGQLEAALERIAFQLEKAEELRRQVKSAMTYPVVVMVFAFVVLIGLVAFLVPTFVKTLQDAASTSGESAELPTLTKITIGMSDLVTQRFYLLIAGAVGGIFGFKKWKAGERGRAQWDRLKLKMPIKIGDVVQKVALARWSRTLSGLTAAGVPLLQAIEITGKTSGNTQVENAMDEVYANVKQGGTISAPLRNSDVFPNMVSHMVGVGEETGALEQMLAKIADFYEAETDATIKSLTSIIEPVMIMFVGGMVGFIVISMYLPMFAIYDKIG